MTAQDIAQYISQLPGGARVTVTFEVEDGTADGSAQTAVVSAQAQPATTQQGQASVPAAPCSVKLDEARAASGIPIRELQRAVRGGFLKHVRKRDGKDAGAYLVELSDVALYAAKREKIRQGKQRAPSGWPGPKGRV